MEVAELVGLHARTRLEQGPGDHVIVMHPWGAHVVAGDFLGLRELCDSPVEVSSLSADALRFLRAFPFLVVRTFVVDDVPVLRLVPQGVDARPASLGDDVPVCLSRFALMRRDGDRLALESPLALYRAELAPSCGAAVTSLVQPRSVSEFDGVDQVVVRELAAAGLLGAPGDPDLSTWEFHDLLFHTRSTAGRHDNPVGGHYVHRDDVPPLPVVKPPPPGAAIALPTPVSPRDVPFTTVLDGRRSRRSFGQDAMTLDQLGELLHRAARVRSVQQGSPYDTTTRPYPSGGAAYDLELYPAVRRCQGLEPGVYHYDPLDHVLRLVSGEFERLTRCPPEFVRPPDVKLLITSRFRRVSWKYSSIAHGLTLRNVGVLYQTLYLVAESMGLAACALGGGDIALSERVLGVPFTEESTVGEFALGTRSRPEA